MFARQLIKAATENLGTVDLPACYPDQAAQDRYATGLLCRTAESASAAFMRRVRAGEQARLAARLESVRAASLAPTVAVGYGADLPTVAG